MNARFNAPDAPPRATALTVTCPFCGLLCDDVSVAPAADGSVAVLERGCALSRTGFARQSAPAEDTSRIGGAPAAFADAARAAARILKEAQRPVIGALATDVAGMRAALELADLCGATLDHANSEAKFRNLLAFQDRGAITTTLSEVRNRADLFVVVGTDIVSRFPRFFERVTPEGETLFGLRGSDRRAIFIGARPPPEAPAAAEYIACERSALPEVLSALAALTSDTRLDAPVAGTVPMQRLREVAETMRAARYGVMVWAAGDLEFAHAELAVQAMFRTLMNLNRTTRFSGVPLAGNELTADAVLLWQVGFPYRTSFAAGRAEYDPYLYSAKRLIARREADALVWISGFDEVPPPDSAGLPLILLANPAAQAAARADVFLPIGTPGIDHPGHLVRTDKVVTLRLAAVRPSQRASAAQALRAIALELRAC